MIRHAFLLVVLIGTCSCVSSRHHVPSCEVSPTETNAAPRDVVTRVGNWAYEVVPLAKKAKLTPLGQDPNLEANYTYTASRVNKYIDALSLELVKDPKDFNCDALQDLTNKTDMDVRNFQRFVASGTNTAAVDVAVLAPIVAELLGTTWKTYRDAAKENKVEAKARRDELIAALMGKKLNENLDQL